MRRQYKNGDQIHLHTGCNGCSPCSVNGTIVHESGCPDSWRDYTKDCFECGCEYLPEERHQSLCFSCANPEPPECDIKTIQLDLPSFFASYLINGDSSGLTDQEIQEIDSFLEKEGAGHCMSMSEESWFSWRNDMNTVGGDVATFTFSVS